MHEILGQCVVAPGIFGNQAPDSGNAELLAIGGSPEQKERWMYPLLARRAAQLLLHDRAGRGRRSDPAHHPGRPRR